jgi:hypothetical protein
MNTLIFSFILLVTIKLNEAAYCNGKPDPNAKVIFK